MLTKISIKVCSPTENIVFEFEEMLKKWLPKDFRSDFHGKHILNHPNSEKLTVLLMILNDKEIIGGAILADGLSLNDFMDSQKIEKVNEYNHNGILNFSYFYILPKYRGKGFGTEFLTQLQFLYPNIWLASSNERLEFYNRNGYEIVFSPIVQEKTFLLVSKGTKNVISSLHNSSCVTHIGATKI